MRLIHCALIIVVRQLGIHTLYVSIPLFYNFLSKKKSKSRSFPKFFDEEARRRLETLWSSILRSSNIFKEIKILKSTYMLFFLDHLKKCDFSFVFWNLILVCKIIMCVSIAAKQHLAKEGGKANTIALSLSVQESLFMKVWKVILQDKSNFTRRKGNFTRQKVNFTRQK